MKAMSFFIPAFFLSLGAYALPAASPPLNVMLHDAAGKSVGSATISGQAMGVKVHLELMGLKPGEHAVHFHAKGVCKGPDFKSAGDHFAVPGSAHGFDNPKGPHLGDMRNFTVGADGKASVDVMDERVTVEKGPASLQQKGGTALVIHAKGDDYKSQPAGNAGDRVACGEIRGI